MTSRLMRALLVVCGTLCVSLGVLGIFLPLLPTTVFLLMAAACYARSSDRFYQRLITNRWLGHYIVNHREGRGMRRRDKIVTLVMLWTGIGTSMSGPWTPRGCASCCSPSRQGSRHTSSSCRRSSQACPYLTGHPHPTSSQVPRFADRNSASISCMFRRVISSG